jgi:FLYWCH zinc finger domain
MCRSEYVTIHVPSSHMDASFAIYEEGDVKGDDVLDDSELTFVTSPWSTKCLVYNDFLYNCHSSHGNKVYWRCHNYSR